MNRRFFISMLSGACASLGIPLPAWAVKQEWLLASIPKKNTIDEHPYLLLFGFSNRFTKEGALAILNNHPDKYIIGKIFPYIEKPYGEVNHNYKVGDNIFKKEFSLLKRNPDYENARYEIILEEIRQDGNNSYCHYQLVDRLIGHNQDGSPVLI